MIAYALRGVIFFLLALMIVLMVCKVLYIKEHLAHTPDSELPYGNIGDSTGNTTVAGSSVIPAAPFPLRSTLPPALANAYAFGTTGDARPYLIDTASFFVCEIPVFMLS